LITNKDLIRELIDENPEGIIRIINRKGKLLKGCSIIVTSPEISEIRI